MTELWRKIASLSAVLLLAVSAVAILPGCRKQGPAERAGEKVDKAVEDVGEGLEEATE